MGDNVKKLQYHPQKEATGIAMPCLCALHPGQAVHAATARGQGWGAALLAREGAVDSLAQVPLEP